MSNDIKKQKKQKILMCYHSSQYGGVEKQIYDIILGLSNVYDFYIAIPEGPLIEEYMKAGAVKHYDIKPKFEADLSYSYMVYKILKNEKIEVLHSHELLTGSLAVFGGWLARIPKRIYHVHTPFVEWKHASYKKYFSLVVNTIVNFFAGNIFATDVLALTESIKNTRVKKEFILPSKIRVIPNGVDLKSIKTSEQLRQKYRQKYKIPDNAIVLGNISRFTEEKGHEVLIRAYQKAINTDLKMMDNTLLLLAGGGKLLEEMKDLAKKLEISDRIIFTGRFEDSDRAGLINAFDAFVFPTYAEGFGIVLVEAMAGRLPCLVTDLPVLRDVGGEAVKYCDNRNPDVLSKAIIEFIREKNEWENLKEASYIKAQNYSMSQFINNYKKLYAIK